MLSPKTLAHRLRVLENQAKLAAERDAARPSETQMTMPLLVEVRAPEGPTPRVRRARSKTRAHQPEFGDL